MKKKKREILDVIRDQCQNQFINKPVLNAYNSKNKIPIIFNKVDILRGSERYYYDSLSRLFYGNEDKLGIKRGVEASFVFSIYPVNFITRRRNTIKFICECQRMIIY